MSVLVLLRSPAAYTLNADSGSVALSGQAASLKRGSLVVAASGTFAISGQASTVKRGLRLTATGGSVALSGTAVTLRPARKLTAAAGTLALGGTAASLVRGLRLTAAAGSLAASGTVASLRVGHALAAASGTFSATGAAVAFARGYKLSTGSGTYALVGQAIGLLWGRALPAVMGGYELAGSDAALTYTANSVPVVTAPAEPTSGGTWYGQPVRPVARRIPAVHGAPVQFLRGRVLRAEPGSAESVQPVVVPVRARRVVVDVPKIEAPAAPPAVAAPIPAPLTHYAMVAEAAAYSTTGNVIQMRQARRLQAAPGSVDAPTPDHPFTDDDMLAILLLLAA